MKSRNKITRAVILAAGMLLLAGTGAYAKTFKVAVLGAKK